MDSATKGRGSSSNGRMKAVRHESLVFMGGAGQKKKRRLMTRKPGVKVVASSRQGQVVAGSLLGEVVETYLRFYAAGSSHSSRAKRNDLKKFLSFMGEIVGHVSNRGVRVDQWDQSSTQRFVEALISRGEAPATVARRLATLKHFGRTLAEKVPGYTNPAREVRPPRLEVTKPKALSPHDVERLQQFLIAGARSAKDFKSLRDRVMVMTLLATGLRADEVRIMRRGQVDPKGEWFESVRTKGRRFRNVYIPTSLRPMLREYLVSRETLLKRYFPQLKVSFDQQMPLFVSTYGADITNPESFQVGPKSLWRIVNKLSGEVSLHPHLLRHTFAIGLLNHTGDIRLVSQALGHGDVKVTMRYTERRSEEVAQAVESMGGQGAGRARRQSIKRGQGS